MLEIIPNKTTADVIREMNDAQICAFLTLWDGNAANLVFAVYRATKYKPTSVLKFNACAEEAMKDIWFPNNELDLARFGEEL